MFYLHPLMLLGGLLAMAAFTLSVIGSLNGNLMVTGIAMAMAVLGLILLIIGNILE